MTRLLTRRNVLVGLGGLTLTGGVGAGVMNAFQHRKAAEQAHEVIVYKDASCACCQAWADHLVLAGFSVQIVNQADLTELKRSLGVPDDLASCHTATWRDYVIEGHVPADDIKELAKRYPFGHAPIRGLAVPGMPIGSPGMEIAGQPSEPFHVYAFKRDGARSVFMAHLS